MSNKSMGIDKLKDTFSDLNTAFDQWEKIEKLLTSEPNKQSVEKRTQELLEEVKKQLDAFNAVEVSPENPNEIKPQPQPA